ncbi:Wzz/FepE/Etk N-terminal domain-containing protein, partial [Acidimangrovimonas sediminis]|uniref:Wzz/FepE/Etk N-terminal domain-containing protein n=1 Tax=Acidimangrovimonas sediminis TaxID=2056283 RepID=UPI001E5D6876
MTQPSSSDFQFARSQTQQEDDDSFDIAAFVRPLWRGKWIILLCTLVMMAIGGYYAYRVAVPIYTATSVVMLETADSSETVTNIQNIVAGLSSDTVALNSEVQVIQSRE